MAIQTFTTGQVLTAAQQNVVAKGSDLPTVGVTRTAALTPASNVAITWDTEDWDNDTMFAASSDTITIKTAGIYHIFWYVNLGGTSGTVAPNLVINGAESYALDINSFGRQAINYTIKFAANDTLKARVYFSAGTFTATGSKLVVQYLGINA